MPFNIHFEKDASFQAEPSDPEREATLNKLSEMLDEGLLDDREVEIDVASAPGMPMVQMFGQTGMEVRLRPFKTPCLPPWVETKASEGKLKFPKLLNFFHKRKPTSSSIWMQCTKTP